MRFMKRRLLKRSANAEWTAALEGYELHCKQIESQLPAIASILRESNFHDECVDSVSSVDKRRVSVELRSRRLEFSGVSYATFPSPGQFDSVVWLYDEIDLVRPGVFAVRALFDEGGLEIHATDAKIYDRVKRRYIVPAEPADPPPTLFLDRSGSRSVRGKRKSR